MGGYENFALKCERIVNSKQSVKTPIFCSLLKNTKEAKWVQLYPELSLLLMEN